ncbi:MULTISPECIES: acyl carrier protein [unclassified Streptomyces]|uniref:acyl carrier protein n=1 Tax=unclassified Streptomyces TaxID=2593676 RepID=UPI003659FF15
MTFSAPPKAAASLYGWLTDRLAVYLDRAPESIDPTVPLAVYGMDSVCALSLCGDVEDDFGIAVEPTLAWDHPTVAALAGHLAERGVRPPADGRRP